MSPTINPIPAQRRSARLPLFRVCILLILLLLISLVGTSFAQAEVGLSDKVEKGLDALLAFCAADQQNLNNEMSAFDPVIQFVRQAPEMADATPRTRRNAEGSFIAYSLKRSLQDVIRYNYNDRVPAGAVNPSSINFASWKQVSGHSNSKGLPELWKSLEKLSAPTVVRGVVRETISPDLHTGAYYVYDLQRGLLLMRQGTLRVVISLSDQIGDSEVGRKGYIVGDDQDWNYLYTRDQGIDKTGLGWVKSRIYKFFSVCCYIEDDLQPGVVKVGVFQWLNAGWAGINIVDASHIQKGMERYAVQFKGMMESEQMPEPTTLEQIYTDLEQTDEVILREKASEVSRFIQMKAQEDPALKGKDAVKSFDYRIYVAGMNKAQLISMLMREFVKMRLGKETPLAGSFWLAIQNTAAYPKVQPLS